MIYLDHAAATPLSDAAWSAMVPYLREHFGNPAEPHAAGRAARAGLTAARRAVGEAVGVRPSDVVFTGGGTEADNLVLLGRAAGRPDGRLVTTCVEHPAVRHTLQALEATGREVVWLPVDGDGLLDPELLHATLRAGDALVCVMWANNVTGVVQPVAALAEVCAAADVPLHLDAVQAATGVQVDVRALGPRVTAALAAHKVGGPKGVGAIVGPGVRDVPPVLHGGGQERGLRPGTQNVAGAVGFAAALTERQGPDASAERAARATRRDRLEAAVGLEVAGAGAPRLPGHALLLCDGVRGDTLVHVLDEAGVCVAAGSACASGSAEPSHVLTAMGFEPRRARSGLRVTLGPATTDAEVDRFLEVLGAALGPLRLAAASAR